jgi:Leucine-rich repeat (LRR) protein
MEVETADQNFTPVDWHLNGFTSEVLGRVAFFSDAWDVGRLYCCGDVHLNKMLLSPSALRTIRHVSLDPLEVALPGFLSQLTGLKSLSIICDGIPLYTKTSLSPSCADLILRNAENLEELILWQVKNIECLLSKVYGEPSNASKASKAKKGRGSKKGKKEKPRFLFPNLTSLRLNSGSPAMGVILRDLPPHLTSLYLYPSGGLAADSDDGGDEDDFSLPPWVFANLPTSLSTFYFEYDMDINLTESWPTRLPSLTALELKSSQGISYDLETISSLPASLTLLRLCTDSFYLDTEPDTGDLNSDGDSDPDSFDNTPADIAPLFPLFPPSLVDLCIGFECDPEALQQLPCWDSLRHLDLAYLKKLPGTLPPHLETLSLSECKYSDLSALPSSLTSLETSWHRKNTHGLVGITLSNLKKLTTPLLEVGQVQDIPPSVTTLEVDWTRRATQLKNGNDIATLLLALPKSSLSRVVDSQNWTWVRVKELGKFFFNDMRLPTQDEQNSVEGSSEWSSLPYSGIGGTGWTSLGHAIAMDSVLLLQEILRFMPSLWHEIALPLALDTSIRHGSWKMLLWFEKHHFLPAWRKLESSPYFIANSCVTAAIVSNRTDMADWLLQRDFRIKLGRSGLGNPVVVALANDCVPLLKHCVGLILDGQKSSMDEDSVDADDLMEDQYLVNLPQIRYKALKKGAFECWKYLMSLDDAKNASDRPLTEILDIRSLIYSKAIDTKCFDLVEELMKQHDLVVQRIRLQAHANTKKSSSRRARGRANPRREVLTEMPTTIGEYVIESLQNDPYLISPCEKGHPFPVFQWFLDHHFLTINGVIGEYPSLAAVMLDHIHQIQEGRMDGGADNDDGDDDDAENGVEDDILARDVDTENAILALNWLHQQGADLLNIPQLPSFIESTPTNIHQMISEWPHRAKFEQAIALGTLTLPNLPAAPSKPGKATQKGKR